MKKWTLYTFILFGIVLGYYLTRTQKFFTNTIEAPPRKTQLSQSFEPKKFHSKIFQRIEKIKSDKLQQASVSDEIRTESN